METYAFAAYDRDAVGDGSPEIRAAMAAKNQTKAETSENE